MSLERLQSETPAVFVSLPRNDPELARAAADAGADGVKVHLNLNHQASGNDFGTIEEEGDALRAIADLNVPVGVVPGLDETTVRRNLPRLEELPVDFVDAHADHLPVEVLVESDLQTWIAPGEEPTREDISTLQQVGADAMEVGLVPKEEYGRPCSLALAAEYIDLGKWTSLPLIVPTQFERRPIDAVYLADHGVNNFLLGTIVMDDTPEGVAETTAAFMDALH